MRDVIGVRFGDSNKIYYFDVNGFTCVKGDFGIVETERGLQFGKFVTDVISVDESKLNSELKNVISLASDEDIVQNSKNEVDAEEAFNFACKFVKELGLDMNVLGASFTFDRKQLMINFMADDRVDFRELARKLAGIYKTRIELRQIGVRDKARVVGGYGQCGQKLCCSSFLSDISSVSINMAKNQSLALNPQKINGVCGRLMCCLSYENDCYSEYKKGLPSVGEKIKHNGKNCKVISVDLFARSYKIESEDAEIFEINE